MNDLDPLRFPIGPFRPDPSLSPQKRSGFMDEIAAFPAKLRGVVEDMSEEDLDTQYREGGWTVRQVVHHVPDSHLQGYVRFKLAITEDTPTIRTYHQASWGETEDARTGPVDHSLDLLDALHKRWVFFLRALSDEDFERTYQHPEMGEISLGTTVQLYAWHGKHHLAHVELVAEKG
ncbi:MAG: putative metal-dependent hydrolase [Gemmatimonadetes bacterium]|nr:putative metal-dependent hydrolase [Gemmatimonadota bacterium]